MFPTFEPRRRAVSYHGDGRDDREIEDRKEQDERRKKIDDLLYNLDSPIHGERTAAITELSSMLEEPIGYFHHARIADALCVCSTITAAQGRKFAMECIDASKNAIKEERLQFGTNARQVFDDFIARATEELTLALQDEEGVDEDRALKEAKRFGSGNTAAGSASSCGLSGLVEHEEDDDQEMNWVMDTDNLVFTHEEDDLYDEDEARPSLAGSSVLSELSAISTPSAADSAPNTNITTILATTSSLTLQDSDPPSSGESLESRITNINSDAPIIHHVETEFFIPNNDDGEYKHDPRVNVLLQSVFELLVHTGDLGGMRHVLTEFVREHGVRNFTGLNDDEEENAEAEKSGEDDD